MSKEDYESGAIACSLCGQELNRNVLLPDGTVLLCCMDYGMKHILGNLREQSYDEIMNGGEMQRIKKCMNDELKDDILCRSCALSHLIHNKE